MPDASAPLLAFIDTNLLVECRVLEALDFRALLSAPLVHLVATPTIVDELERLKDSPRAGMPGAKKRRAQARLAAIESRLFPTPQPAPPEPVELATGVFLAWWDELDAEVFKRERLTWEVNDHILVGYALTAREHGARVVLVSDDVGARLTAKSRGLEAHGVPDDWMEGWATSTTSTR